MAPARTDDPIDDPVTAEYDIFLTPHSHQQIYLLQYPNRPRTQPYNHRAGAAPSNVRIKPTSGYLEIDTQLNTDRHFNRHQALKWGGAVSDARDAKALQNGILEGASLDTLPTYGMAGGLASTGGARGMGRRLGGAGFKDEADRENAIQNDINAFHAAKMEGRVMHTQTLGGQIIKHESADEAGKPVYFVGAFRGKELHLSRVTGSVQMRPQFHHLDAEDQRSRLISGGGGHAFPTTLPTDPAPADGNASSSTAPSERARLVHQSYKQAPSGMANPRGELEEHANAMRVALQTAAEEPWTALEFVDEDEGAAYTAWEERMFVRDTAGAVKLKSSLDGEAYLDLVSGRPGSPSRVRKGRGRRRRSGGESGEEGE